MGRISVLSAKNCKLMAFMFKMMEHCSKDYRIQDINSTAVLYYQHQGKLEQNESDNIEVLDDKNNWVKTMKDIVMYLKIMRDMKGTPLAFVIWCHGKVAHIPHGSGAYLNLDEEMIARAPIVNISSNLMLS